MRKALTLLAFCAGNANAFMVDHEMVERNSECRRFAWDVAHAVSAADLGLSKVQISMIFDQELELGKGGEVTAFNGLKDSETNYDYRSRAISIVNASTAIDKYNERFRTNSVFPKSWRGAYSKASEFCGKNEQNYIQSTIGCRIKLNHKYYQGTPIFVEGTGRDPGSIKGLCE